jgi:copper chaperone CopZ
MNTTHQNTYTLTGLHCGSCIRKVTQALQPFATDVEVTLEPMQAVLTGEIDKTPSTETLAALQMAISTAGNYGIELKRPIVQAFNANTPISNVAINSTPNDLARSWLGTYYPLLLIVFFILAASVLIQVGLHAGSMGEPMGLFMHFGMGLMALTAGETMRYFMAGFFLVFSFFKLLDIRAFANAYAGYDLLAARWHGWGLVYPFVELTLGTAYLANFNPILTHWVTVIVMGFSAIGVIRAVANKTQIQCACLGTVFKLPMSTVTIVEDVGMVLMAAWMLVRL